MTAAPTTCSVLLSDVVSALLLKASIGLADQNLTALSSIWVEGVGIGRQSNVLQALQTLEQAFLFDLVEVDWSVKAVLRGGAPIASIVETDLGAVSGEPKLPTPKLDDTHQQDLDLPRRVEVTYQSAALDYQPNTQAAQRMSTTQSSRSVIATEITLVMDEASARQVAQHLLWLAWLYRNQITITLPPSYVRYDAADVLTLTADGASRPLYVNSAEWGADNVVTIKGVLSDEIAVTPDTLPGISPYFTTQVGGAIEPTILLLYDAPLLRDADNTFGFYVSARGADAGWVGANVYKSSDGTTYTGVANLSVAVVAGTTTTLLASAPYELIDRTHTVTVYVGSGTLASVTELEMLNGKNIALIGSELVGFATATLIAPGTYTLSTLLRGIQGSDWARGSHASGDRFILLRSDGSTKSLDLPGGEFNVSRDYKGVSLGQSLSSVAAQVFASACLRIKPLAPVFPSSSRDGSSNLSIGWVPRARVDADLHDGADTGLDEPSELYSVDVLHSGLVVRTIAATSPAASYTAADQTTDFGSPQSSVAVVVYQVSNRVGRGYPLNATV